MTRSVFRKIALVVGSTVFALLLLELALQGASLFVRVTSRGGSFTSGKVRVLCLGDSNTYGLAVERNESYPARLEENCSGEIRRGIRIPGTGVRIGNREAGRRQDGRPRE